ncbi:MAG TPA: hypothetical protein VNZ26_27105 [Vicinamibacterales bacterium]|jgi:hypothetical protein|nr:hypothetical protein [Vicinamibacterales bacterium]
MISRLSCLCFALVVELFQPAALCAQITAQARVAPTPPWDKGIQPISPESYYNAIECGKQGGTDPPCVFWDTGLCKNADFVLTAYTAYKSVAYEVWRVVNQKQPAPQPSYGEAQRTRVTIAIKPAPGSKNPLTNLVVKHGGRIMTPVDRSVSTDGGRFTFDYPAFAPSADVALDLVGQSKTISCRIPQEVLKTFR